MVFVVLVAFLIGGIAGLRAMTAPAAVAWAAHLGKLDLSEIGVDLSAHPWVVWVLTALAIGELVSDKLPSTASRKVPIQFGTRIFMGGLCGVALAASADLLIVGAIAGAVGAVVGTLAGAAGRGRLAAALGRDLPAALVEDALAIVGAAAILTVLA